MTGGFGSYAEISYDEISIHGINFYKADNVTPLGLQSTCGSNYVPNGSHVPAFIDRQNFSFYKVPDSIFDSYKLVWARWMGTEQIKSFDLEST